MKLEPLTNKHDILIYVLLDLYNMYYISITVHIAVEYTPHIIPWTFFSCQKKKCFCFVMFNDLRMWCFIIPRFLCYFNMNSDLFVQVQVLAHLFF